MSINGGEVISDRFSDEPVTDWLKAQVDALDKAIEMGE